MNREIRHLLYVWLGLLALLAATLSVMLLPMKEIHPALNFIIAAAKATLIAVFFMHLKGGSTLSRLIAVAGFFWLMLLIGLSFTDYWTRPVAPLG